MELVSEEKNWFKKIYKVTEKYLKEKANGVNLEKYYTPSFEYDVINNKKIKNEKIFQRIIISLNNKESGKARIKKQTENPDFENDNAIREVLCDYDYCEIIKKYKNGYEELNTSLIKKGNFRNNKNTMRFAHGVYSAAKLFSKTNIIEKIKKAYGNDEMTEKVIIELMGIYNIGYALASDFLKESGYDSLVKPDIHIRDICGEVLKVIYFKNEEYEVTPKDRTCLEIMKKIAKANNSTCYKIDKMFWLIGSNNFYLDQSNNLTIKMSKAEFFQYLESNIKTS